MTAAGRCEKTTTTMMTMTTTMTMTTMTTAMTMTMMRMMNDE
jgi:hypothetical protein